MIFYLVRIDGEEPFKIQLAAGAHLFGRGVLLNCNDNRVSRHHGLFTVTDDTITITALHHHNPCFYMKKDTEGVFILQYNYAVELSNGDRFSLVPDKYWYELICTAPAAPLTFISSERENNIKKIKMEQKENTVKQEVPNSEDGFERDNSELLWFYDDKLSFEAAGPESPSMLTARNEEANQNMASAENHILPSQSPMALAACSLAKRAHASDEAFDIKKVKIEPADSPQAGTSYQADPSSSLLQPKVEPPESGDSTPAPAEAGAAAAAAAGAAPGNRERCWYGLQCYRKNPVHKKEFSHPSDSDWGSGERAACPYGARCWKRDPRHWRDHAHPAGLAGPAEPAPPPSGVQVQYRMVRRQRHVYCINATTVNIYDDPLPPEDSDEDSVDLEYEF